MNDYVYTDFNWCPDCGLPRGVCDCDKRSHFDSDDWNDDWLADDPNRCPECGADITVDDDWIYCTDTNECGYSEYIGDEDDVE